MRRAEREAQYRLPRLDLASITLANGEELEVRELHPDIDEIREVRKLIIGAHAVGGFGKDFAKAMYMPEGETTLKKVRTAIQVRENDENNTNKRRIAAFNADGEPVYSFEDGAAMHTDLPKGSSRALWVARRLSAHLPGRDAFHVFPPLEHIGSYYRIDSATDPEYRGQGVALAVAVIALESIMRVNGHPLRAAGAISYVSDGHELHSAPFLKEIGFEPTDLTTAHEVEGQDPLPIRLYAAGSTRKVLERARTKLDARGVTVSLSPDQN